LRIDRRAGSPDPACRHVSPSTRALARWIEAVSWGFVVLGLALPFAFHTGAFTIYRDAIAGWAYGSTSVPAADQRLLDLMLGITGGSIAGKWVVHALLARGPLADGRSWARDLTLRGLASWFVVDSVASLALGATFNVWMINLAPLVLVGAPLVLFHRGFATDPGPAPATASCSASRWSSRACLYASVFGAATGIAIAFGASTPLLSPWFAALERAQYGGAALGEPARRLATFFFGPIGGCTLAQFVMLAGFLRRDGASRRAAAAGTLSILAWFAIDSGYGLANAGLFNIAMVNVPALVVTLPPWLLLAGSLRKPTD
jgi:hypothetical protein